VPFQDSIGKVRVLGLALWLGVFAWAAELCPPTAASTVSGTAGPLRWSSFKGEPRPGKFCAGGEVRSQPPLEVSWPDAGIEKAAGGWLQVAECCFDRVEQRRSTLQVGKPPKPFAVSLWSAAEEGLANHEEGYPDLIEEDARVRQMSIRGSLPVGGKDVRLDVVLKSTASQFGGQYAYQYVITNRSAPRVEVDWGQLAEMKKKIRPSVQSSANTVTYIFLSHLQPEEGDSRIILTTGTGISLSTFKMGGFQINFK
jgi:hypothetical protein